MPSSASCMTTTSCTEYMAKLYNEIYQPAPDTMVFALEKPATIASIEKKATFTSFDDGVTVLEELGSSGISYLIRWTVAKTTTYNQLDHDRGSCTAVGRPVHPATAPGQYPLEETYTISGDRLLGFLSRFDDDDSYDRNTERLLKFLAWVALGKFL